MDKNCEIIQTPVSQGALDEIIVLATEKGRGFVISPRIDQIKAWAEQGRSWIGRQDDLLVAHLALDECGIDRRPIWEVRTFVGENEYGKTILHDVETGYERKYEHGVFIAVVQEMNLKGIDCFQKAGYMEMQVQSQESLIRQDHFRERDITGRRVLMRSWGEFSK